MHSYPAWKVWLVAIVLLVSALFALPNFYGDAAALQLSRNDRAAMAEADLGSVTTALAAKNIPVEASYLAEDRLVLRFHTVEQQLSARGVLQESSGEEYLVALSHVPRTPGWVRAIGLKPMSLGLDLRGGVHFLYEVDVAGAVKQLLSGMERDYRTLLRHERIPFTGVRNNGVDTVAIELRSATDAERATAAIRRQDPTLSVGTSATGEGAELTVKLGPDHIRQRQDFAIEQNITTLRNRVDELGVAEPIVARQGLNRILVQLPGVQDPNEALRVLGATATLEFHLVDDQNDPAEAERLKRAPLGIAAIPDAHRRAGVAQAGGHRLGRAARRRELGIQRGPARGVRQARRARCRRDARDHADAPGPPDGGGVHREEAPDRAAAVPRRAFGH